MELLTKALAELVLPESCQEATLELETKEDMLDKVSLLKKQAVVCRQLKLTRSDGVELNFDDNLALQYTWTGNGKVRWGLGLELNAKTTTDFHTFRLCWRTKVARREYMSYDRLDCLSLSGCPEVKNIAPLEPEDPNST